MEKVAASVRLSRCGWTFLSLLKMKGPRELDLMGYAPYLSSLAAERAYLTPWKHTSEATGQCEALGSFRSTVKKSL
jgi:hypothetical protein